MTTTSGVRTVEAAVVAAKANSRFGDTYAHGTEGVHFFTRGKVVTSRCSTRANGGINLGFPQNV